MMRAGRLRTAVIAAVGILLLGCTTTTLWKMPPPLPDRYSIVYDQLVIHSNDALPTQHRLLDDLRVQRGELLTKLNLPSSEEPIHVYLFNSEPEFHGFLERHYPAVPSRRAFFVKSDTRLAVFAQWGDRVAEDLRHEVAHGYLHSVLPYIPLWLDEGLAEYFEVPRGQAGVNRPHVQLLLTRLLQQGWRPNMMRLEGLRNAGEMTQDDYAESWAWVHWLLEGPHRDDAVLQDYLRSLKAGELYQPLAARLRLQYPHAEQQMAEHLYSLAPRP